MLVMLVVPVKLNSGPGIWIVAVEATDADVPRFGWSICTVVKALIAGTKPRKSTLVPKMNLELLGWLRVASPGRLNSAPNFLSSLLALINQGDSLGFANRD